MENLEEYFINEEDLKKKIATGSQQIQSNKTTLSNTPTASKSLSESKENKTKRNLYKRISIKDFFEGAPGATSVSQSIRLSEDILSQLKAVSFFMKQQHGPKHSLKSYIESILIRHLKEYEDEIALLGKTEIFNRKRSPD